MRRQQEALSEAIGTDAFLDIVANLVGILLILLMVIGARMDDATKSVATPPPTSTQPAPEVIAALTPVEPLPPVASLQLPELEIPDPNEARLELSRLKQSIFQADEEAKKLNLAMKLQKIERDNLMLAVTNAERELERRRNSLSEAQRNNVSNDLERKQAEEEYASIVDQLEMLKQTAEQEQTEVLQHIATPIAKTVFVREEHFRLKNGRLLYVPMNEMTNVLRREAPKKMWKLKNAQQTTEAIGPYLGFEMRYTLRRNRVPYRTESGATAAREVVELDRFVMVPVGATDGESIGDALNATSAFRSRLSSWNPRETIVTVWTYPDSFGDFRKLKAELYKIGYLTAARPLPANQLISGSPQGTRSAAQ